MPKNAKKRAYKEKEFQAYVMWKSIPSYLTGSSRTALRFYGFEDPLAYKVADIRNQTEFAKRFKIKDLGTLTDWNNKIEEKDLHNVKFKEVMVKQCGNVLMALAFKAIKTGNAREVLAFMKIVEGFDPKRRSIDRNNESSDHEAIYTLSPERKARIKELFKRNAHNRKSTT